MGSVRNQFGLAVLEKRAVADDEVGERQHHEEEAEDQEQDAVGQQHADGREREEKIKALVKKEVPQQEITQHKTDEQQRQQR